MATYHVTAYLHTTKRLIIQAETREEAIKKASAVARKRYGDAFAGSLSVPYLTKEPTP